MTERDVILDGDSMRALSHPVRVELVTLLRKNGPSTASRLAEQLGLNSGATSYHLRQLAAAGLVEEADDLGNKRDRWWRAGFRSAYFESSSFADDPDAAMAYLNAVASSYAGRLVDFGRRWPNLPDPWSRTATMSDFPKRLTPAEAESLITEINAVIARYRDDDATIAAQAPADARPVSVQLQVIPNP